MQTFHVPLHDPERIAEVIEQIKAASVSKSAKPPLLFDAAALQARAVTHEQRTKEWFEQRLHTLNGSEIASVLGENVYDKFGHDVLCRKLGIQPYFSDQAKLAVEHGKQYEPFVIARYEQLFGTIVHEFGSIQHPMYPSLAASPDGVTDEGILLEIKCPYSRVLKPEEHIPIYYKAQVCMNLETTQRDVAHFVQYVPGKDQPGSGKNQLDHEQLIITVYHREPDWFDNALPRLQAWLERIEHWKRHFNPEDEESINTCFAFDREHKFRSPTKHRLTKEFKYQQSLKQMDEDRKQTDEDAGNAPSARGLERFAHLASVSVSAEPEPEPEPAPPSSSMRARGLERYAFLIK